MQNTSVDCVLCYIYSCSLCVLDSPLTAKLMLLCSVTVDGNFRKSRFSRNGEVTFCRKKLSIFGKHCRHRRLVTNFMALAAQKVLYFTGNPPKTRHNDIGRQESKSKKDKIILQRAQKTPWKSWNSKHSLWFVLRLLLWIPPDPAPRGFRIWFRISAVAANSSVVAWTKFRSTTLAHKRGPKHGAGQKDRELRDRMQAFRTIDLCGALVG